MAQDAGQILTAANGQVYAATYGTTAPTTEVSALAGGFLELGLVSEDGVKWKSGRETRDQKAWQSARPVGQKVVELSDEVSFSLMQFNKTNVGFALGGATTSTVSAGHYKVTPAAITVIDYRALCVDFQNGSYHYRLYTPRGIITSEVELNLVRTDDMLLPVTYKCTPIDAATDPWLLFTDDPAFS